jgi:hypothetical protein
MRNHHLAIILAHERERDLRQARESVSAPRQLADHDDRAGRREDARFFARSRLRAPSAQLCSESPEAAE